MKKQIELLDKALWVLGAIRHFEMLKKDRVNQSKHPLSIGTHHETMLMDKADTCQRAIDRLKKYYNKLACEIMVNQLSAPVESFKEQKRCQN